MHLHRSPLGVIVQAPAKLNLYFEVLGKRADGYHEIETLVTPIDLYDTLYFQETDGDQVEFACHRVSAAWAAEGSRLEDVPDGPANLVVRAVELLRERAGVRKGARVRLIKRIPSAAGLGGGSSDAAAALAAANAGWGLGLSRAELERLGAELGSDVPLFFAPGPAFCRGRGELVETLPGFGMLDFVVVRPPAGLSTAAVYKVCRPAAKTRSVKPLLEALYCGNLAEAGRRMFNRLESAAETLSSWIEKLRLELRQADCLGAQLSGSGTCYFGLCRHARHARRVARRLQAKGIGIAWAVRGSR